MVFKPTEQDLLQLQQLGLTTEQVQRQIDNFKEGFPKSHLDAAATPDNGGIICLDDKEIARYEKQYRTLGRGKKILKFIPASGAATRMFKDLYSFAATYFGVAKNFEKEFPEVKEFLENIHSFAFFNDLKACMLRSELDIEEYLHRGDYSTVINFLLKEQYLGYGSLPKALLKFHRYGEVQRTPLEEHIVEGALYAKNSDNTVNLHFTISPEHKKAFRRKLAEVKHYYESTFGIRLKVTFSEQKHYTDIIAVDEQNQPIRDEEGKLVFRPGGHGALIENLNEQRADVIYIKNIDNVVPDWMKHTTVIYKQVLAGMLLELREKVFDALRTLDTQPDQKTLERLTGFAKNDLHIMVPEGCDAPTLHRLLNRPMRICGMVKNLGEPGGGPFYTIDTMGNRSLQIVESAQVNHREPSQEEIFQASTHFNPVDLVCSTKNYRGRYFDLRQFVDPKTGFISKKSKGAQTLKSQELPGLWNGAMAHWITLFVEVPVATFNPVKTVNDLLRKEHREG
ncbi:MAG: DUF4301 family protein [Bacteroidales bacterium]|nr:DUF4301 family protein [Bacteroidales bacterium]